MSYLAVSDPIANSYCPVAAPSHRSLTRTSWSRKPELKVAPSNQNTPPHLEHRRATRCRLTDCVIDRLDSRQIYINVSDNLFESKNGCCLVCEFDSLTSPACCAQKHFQIFASRCCPMRGSHHLIETANLPLHFN